MRSASVFNYDHQVQEEGESPMESKLHIRSALPADLDWLIAHDKHISAQELKHLISIGRVYLLECGNHIAGWLRYGLFWDNMPFLNMLYLLEPYRGKGYGKHFITGWEAQMRLAGFHIIMTSTSSNEDAQHFYYKMGYSATGGFTPYHEPYELLLIKSL